MLKNLPKNLALAAAVALGSTAAQAAIVNGFANGGFEVLGTPENPALGWAQGNDGYSISNDARTGSYSARLASAPVKAAVLLQNSIDDGGMAPLTVGDTPDFSFWAKGFAGTTGNANYALRYLDGTGNILANSGPVFFHTAINEDTWTEFTLNLGAVPEGATVAFLEIVQAIGPIGTGPAGEEWLAGEILIDDVFLGIENGVSEVPVPAAAWLFGSALLGLAGAKRKKAA